MVEGYLALGIDNEAERSATVLQYNFPDLSDRTDGIARRRPDWGFWSICSASFGRATSGFDLC